MGHLLNVWEKLYDLKFYAVELNLKTFLFALRISSMFGVFVFFCWCGFFFPGGSLLFFSSFACFPGVSLSLQEG